MIAMPNISVIIAAHNEEKYVGRAVRSILNQRIDVEYEVIVVDDCSTDSTSLELDIFGDAISVVRLSENLGLPTALNRGLHIARGKYVVRLDADDYVSPDYLSFMRRFLEDNSYMDAVACDYQEVDGHEEVIVRRNCLEHPIGCGIMFRRDHLIDIGLYDENFLVHEDRDLRVRFTEKYQIHRLELPLYRYRKHENNMTNNIDKMVEFDERLRDKHKELDE